MLTVVEKVIFLQDVDIFKYTSTEDLAHIAAITEEGSTFLPDGDTVLKVGMNIIAVAARDVVSEVMNLFGSEKPDRLSIF